MEITYTVYMESEDGHKCELHLPIKENEKIEDVAHQSISDFGWEHYNYKITQIKQKEKTC